MNAYQKRMCRSLIGFMRDLQHDPEEEGKYQEWLSRREERRDPATNDSRATPQTAMTVYQTNGNAARSGAA